MKESMMNIIFLLLRVKQLVLELNESSYERTFFSLRYFNLPLDVDDDIFFAQLKEDIAVTSRQKKNKHVACRKNNIKIRN